MRVVITQPSYIPWKGYFDLIAAADHCVLLDEVQYTRRDWRNRNRIKTSSGVVWLTIPVLVSGRFTQKISDVLVVDDTWRADHWNRIRHSYRRAPFFETYATLLEDLFLRHDERELSRIDRVFIEALCHTVGIRTPISLSSQYALVDGATERLAAICEQLGATEYISGPAARAYLDEKAFARAGVAVRYFDYSGYPEYEQLYPPFRHDVSVIDLLVHTGPDAHRYMKMSQ